MTWVPTSLAERVWIERMRLGLSLAEFGELAGAGPRAAAGWEGHGEPIPERCYGVLAKAGVDCDYLRDGLPQQGQVALLKADLLPAFAERRIEFALRLLPKATALKLLAKLAARELDA